MKIYGHRISLDNIENFLKKENIECLCNGNDEEINIYVKGSKINKNNRLSAASKKL